MFDFGVLPPEINSGRMYAGPGAGPMLAAATAWDDLAAELGWSASSYGSVIAGLVGAPWLGPASLSMAAAAAPYVSWLSSTAGQAEQTASQARAAAAAYEAAFAMTVPPPMIAANRLLLMTLVATNFFGQNTPAIMAAEAHYAEMWAQDAAAMYGYAGASAVASAVPGFTLPAPTTNTAGLAEQADAVAKSAVSPASTSAQGSAQAASSTPQLVSVSAVPQTLQSLSSSTMATTPATSLPAGLPTPTNNWLGLTPANYTAIIKQTLTAYFPTGIAQFFASIAQQLTFGHGATAGSGGAWYPTPQFAGLGSGLGIGGTPVSAGIGQAGSIGPLSVPPGWAASAGVNPTTNAAASLSAVSAAEEGGEPGGLLRGMPLSGAARRSTAGFVHKYGFRYPVVPRPPSAG